MFLRPPTLARPGRSFLFGIALAVFGCIVPGIAQAQPAAATEENFNDPFEDANRSIFEFNRSVDSIILVPVAKTYRTVLPEPIRNGIHDFLQNLDAPLVFANDVLQGRPDLASNTLGRFIVNSTVGIGGIFDVASRIDLPYHSNDLGVTFAVWGIGDGPYLMLPVLGPSGLRDAVGQFGEMFGDPGNIIARENHYAWTAFARAGTAGIDTRSRNIESLAEIEKTSLDYYATIRSLYRQRRAAEIRHERANLPNVSPLMGGDSSGTAPISYTVGPASRPGEAPKK